MTPIPRRPRKVSRTRMDSPSFLPANLFSSSRVVARPDDDWERVTNLPRDEQLRLYWKLLYGGEKPCWRKRRSPPRKGCLAVKLQQASSQQPRSDFDTPPGRNAPLMVDETPQKLSVSTKHVHFGDHTAAEYCSEEPVGLLTPLPPDAANRPQRTETPEEWKQRETTKQNASTLAEFDMFLDDEDEDDENVPPPRRRDSVLFSPGNKSLLLEQDDDDSIQDTLANLGRLKALPSLCEPVNRFAEKDAWMDRSLLGSPAVLGTNLGERRDPLMQAHCLSLECDPNDTDDASMSISTLYDSLVALQQLPGVSGVHPVGEAVRIQMVTVGGSVALDTNVSGHVVSIERVLGSPEDKPSLRLVEALLDKKLDQYTPGHWRAEDCVKDLSQFAGRLRLALVDLKSVDQLYELEYSAIAPLSVSIILPTGKRIIATYNASVCRPCKFDCDLSIEPYQTLQQACSKAGSPRA